MITLHYNLSPNPLKVVLALEEMGLPYDPVVVDTRRGEQFAPDHLRLNPNGKVPAIVDDGATVFDSNAILLYLSEKTGRFGPAEGRAERGTFLSWLMFVASGVGPFSGQAVHFKHFAPERIPYANARYQFEADRHFAVLDRRLSSSRYVAGDTYTVVDMGLWGWTRMVPFMLGDDAWDRFPNVKRLHDEISARPAAIKVEAFRTANAGAFKAELDADARAHMFKHLKAA